MEITHTNNERLGSFRVITEEAIVGELTYFIKEGDAVMNLDHTWIEPAYRGQGVGDQLVLMAIVYARESQLKINPMCSFVVRFFEKNPQHEAILK